MTRARHRTALAVIIVLIGLIGNAGRAAVLQSNTERRDREARREEQQRVPDVLKAMGVQPGAMFADIGAGQGFYTVRLARAVGESGRVYAVDVNASTLRSLRSRLKEEGLVNVDVIEGEAADPRLPEGVLDAALIVNAYHEMREHQPMLAGIRRALKPGGRLVIVEPISNDRRGQSRDDQTRNHEIAPAFVERDAREAGFTVVDLQDPFTHRRDDTEWLMVLTPGSPSDPGGFHLPLFASQPRWPRSR